MKKTPLYFAALALAVSFTAPAMAADAPAALLPPATIAIINTQPIMTDSAAAHTIRDQLDQKSKTFQEEIGKRQEALQKEEQDLGKQRTVLSKSAFEEKARAFTKKATEAQKDAQSKKALFDNAAERALGEIQKAVGDIIADLAKEKGFTVALPAGQTMYYDPKLNITNDVMTRLNQKLPKVDVKFDAAPENTGDTSDGASKAKGKK